MRLSKYFPFNPNSVDEIVSGAYGVAASKGFELSALNPPALKPSATLKINEISKELENKGKKIFKLMEA